MTNKCWKLVNGNHQKTAQETVKYEVHGGGGSGLSPQPPTLRKT